jgi:hypothetical protein
MADKKNSPPEFHENANIFDPVTAATGRDIGPERGSSGKPPLEVPKKKVGFYLPVALVDRFDRKFYELKLAGQAVENKSALLEAALELALDDLDRAGESLILRRLRSG